MLKKPAHSFGFYKANGFMKWMQNIRRKIEYVKYKKFVKTLSMRDASSVFSEIYSKNLWSSSESKSGAGSEAVYTANLRKKFPDILKKFHIKSIVDAPCGDYNWMRLVPLAKDISYIGIDVVPDLIQHNINNYSDIQRNFIVMNILDQVPPSSDLFICRDCLFHLSNRDIFLALKNFIKSDSKLFFTSTHINQINFVNSDINTGEFRLLDLFSYPFCMPDDVLYRVEDYIDPYPPREMCLWTRQQVALALQKSTHNDVGNNIIHEDRPA